MKNAHRNFDQQKAISMPSEIQQRLCCRRQYGCKRVNNKINSLYYEN